jgi:hypothetical protein
MKELNRGSKIEDGGSPIKSEAAASDFSILDPLSSILDCLNSWIPAKSMPE